jgi:hypothetical protein
MTLGLALVAAAVAGCSSTTAGPTGAAQDDATISPSSSAASTAPSAAPVASVEPAPSASTASEAPSSPSASPSASAPALLGATASNDVCEVVPNPVSGSSYTCGAAGPGGGTVFYASSTAFACGEGLASTCNYLEVAPNLWAPNSQNSCKKAGGSCGGSAQQTSDFSGNGTGITYCTGSGQKNVISGTWATAVGSGYANTTAMIPVCNPSDAANVARAYDGGGMTDWSVPSELELAALFNFPDRNAIGGFPPAKYWSSTGYSNNNKTATVLNFGSTSNLMSAGLDKNQGWGFRPVRAF